MAPRTRVVSSSSTGSASSPSRPPSESPIEVAYNTAVQAFVRRDHIKTQAAISRLLVLVQADVPKSNESQWYEIKEDREDEGYEWKIKVLKLVISAYASLYSDPSNSSSNNIGTDDFPNEIKEILPPASPDRVLDHVLSICQSTLQTTNLLPPQLVSTLILASLKLKPSTPALDFAHRLTETWLADIPDDFIRLVSGPGNSKAPHYSSTVTGMATAGMRKRIESTREAYLKVVELFVGEVLAREGEYEMARAFLDGEDVLGSKRKETLYRHLRSIETRSINSKSGSSPSNSGILPAQSPSASLVLPTPSASRPQSRNGDRNQGTNRSRSSSTSSSSSERTARPRSAINVNGKGRSTGLAPVPASVSRRTAAGLSKGKERETEVEVDTGSVDTNSTLPVPKRIYVNESPPSGQGPSRRSNKKTPSMVQRNITSILDLIPISVKKRIMSPSFLVSTVLPVPLVIILLAIWIRRRARRPIVGVGTAIVSKAAAAAGSKAQEGPGSGVGAGLVTGLAGSVITADTVRQRLERVRQRGGLKAWVVYWIRWWITKFIGVIKMGLTITYL